MKLYKFLVAAFSLLSLINLSFVQADDNVSSKEDKQVHFMLRKMNVSFVGVDQKISFKRPQFFSAKVIFQNGKAYPFEEDPSNLEKHSDFDAFKDYCVVEFHVGFHNRNRYLHSVNLKGQDLNLKSGSVGAFSELETHPVQKSWKRMWSGSDFSFTNSNDRSDDKDPYSIRFIDCKGNQFKNEVDAIQTHIPGAVVTPTEVTKVTMDSDRNILGIENVEDTTDYAKQQSFSPNNSACAPLGTCDGMKKAYEQGTGGAGDANAEDDGGSTNGAQRK